MSGLFQHSPVFSRFSHVVACVSLHAFPVDGCLDCFHSGAFMNNVAISICVHVFARCWLSIPLGVYRGEKFLGHRTTLDTVLHSHQPRMRMPVAPPPRQHLLLSVVLIAVLVVDVKWRFGDGDKDMLVTRMT